MPSTQLLEHLQATFDAVTVNEKLQVEHFGAISTEMDALKESAVVCPVSEFIRIRATGADRARFLHNFCTNNINDLAAGTGCEAFFTDVKAKVLAHGWILAGDDCHELWMLPGDAQTILQHLNRYIITEDVTIESVPAGWQMLAVMGPGTCDVLASIGPGSSNQTIDSWTPTESGSVFLTTWNDTPIALVMAKEDVAVEAWQNIIRGGAIAAGEIVFDHQRILEGFPRIGADVDSNNLAPEADRVQQAISYTKGCYLGQEPIARLDAMGHVNQKLYRVTVKQSVTDESADDLPEITSLSSATKTNQPALVTLKVKSVSNSDPVRAKLPDGRIATLELS